PVGSIRFLAGSAIPSGYVKANGALLNRSSYPRLWAYAAGSGNLVTEAAWQAGNSAAWSSGDGSATFRLPDLRGEFLRIWDDSRGVDSGRALSAPQSDQNKEHNHGASAGNNNANHYHGVAGNTGNESASHNHGVSGQTGNDDTEHTHSGTTGSDSVEHTHEVPGQGWAGGAGSPVTDRFSQGTNNGGGFTLPTGGRSAAHQHPFTTGGRSAYHKHPVSLTSGNESATHQHPVSLNSGNESAVHQHPITVNNAGGTEARPRNAALAAFIKY
ncbi:MAG TPA: phage tail protein, partial [Elusimicrobiales bacterium]|nr:phage tail protein [Elusimicrobiales bacterium]